MTTKVTDGTITVPQEMVAAAGIGEGEDVHIEVAADGGVHIEREVAFGSGEEFFDDLQARHEKLLSEGR